MIDQTRQYNILYLLLFALFFLGIKSSSAFAGDREVINFNHQWLFIRPQNDDSVFSIIRPKNKNSIKETWQTVNLPHTAFIESIPANKQWQGICWYKKKFTIPKRWKDKKISIHFEGAMQVADVWINGKHLMQHKGGYTPFTIDLTDEIVGNSSNEILVKLDNRDRPDFPPGKPYKDLDFCYYSGLYRNVQLIVTNKNHITDPIQENKTGSGGIFIDATKITKDKAELNLRVHVKNETEYSVSNHIVIDLIDSLNRVVATKEAKPVLIGTFEDHVFQSILEVKQPVLWNPNRPYLYKVRVRVFNQLKVMDELIIRTGIRTISINEQQELLLNGNVIQLYGTNRHQEYPYIGNALSDHAQYRDALKIKEAGLNFVRLSHYPQSSAFLRACDELGLLVMNCVSGWQYFGDSAFAEYSIQEAKELIRRDRNHPSVILWELSVNETEMPIWFMQRMHSLAKAESPIVPKLTAGWVDGYYDVFIPARQHGNAPDYWKLYKKSPLLIAEYGDWEYYAKNAGFNQKEFKDLKEEERSSRQLRKYGEKRLLQQALNYQEAHNDNLRGKIIGDAFWLMYDYSRGYASDIEASGIMDVFRLPKLAYYFFKSQQTPGAIKGQSNISNHAFVKIGALSLTTSTQLVKVYSNCDSIQFFSGSQRILPSAMEAEYADQLRYAPQVYDVQSLENTYLYAKGYVNGRIVAEDRLYAYSKAIGMRLEADISGRYFKADGADCIFLRVYGIDRNGQTDAMCNAEVSFKIISGDVQLIGPQIIEMEAGIGTVVLKAGRREGIVKIMATAKGMKPTMIEIRLKK